MKISADKVAHLGVSLMLAIVVSTVVANLIYGILPGNAGARVALSYVLALIVTLGVGVAKEVRDSKQSGNHFCWKDLAADAVGAVVGSLGALVGYLL